MSGVKVPTMHPDEHPGDAFHMEKWGTNGLHIGVNGNEMVYAAGVIVPRADFLAAVAAECDVLVIDKATLPEVDDRGWLSAGEAALDPEEARLGSEYPRSRALAYLALAEYLDARPLVDEAQVEALYGLLDADEATVIGSGEAVRSLARRLYAAGVRIEVTP